MRGAVKPRVKLRALIPERPGIGDLGHRAPEEDRGEIGDPTDMAQWLQDQSGRLPATPPAPRRAAIDADVGAAAQKVGLRSGLRRDCLRKSKCHVLRLERGDCLSCGPAKSVRALCERAPAAPTGFCVCTKQLRTRRLNFGVFARSASLE